MNILLIKFRHIGDMLLSTPLIANLKHHYPDAEIDVALNEETAPMLRDNPNLRHLYPYRRSAWRKLPWWKRISEEIRYVRTIAHTSYDLVINLTEGQRGAILAWRVSAKQKIGYDHDTWWLKCPGVFDQLIPWRYERHMAMNELGLLEALKLQPFAAPVSITIPEVDQIQVAHQLQQHSVSRYVHVHPLARWRSKCWKEENWAQVIDFLQAQGLKAVLSCGPDSEEIAVLESIATQCTERPLCFAGTLTLKQVAALAENAEFFLGVDTAVMHIASALDVPVLALFGQSDWRWGPWDNRLSIDYLPTTETETVVDFGRNRAIRKPRQGTFVDEKGRKWSRNLFELSVSEMIAIMEQWRGAHEA